MARLLQLGFLLTWAACDGGTAVAKSRLRWQRALRVPVRTEAEQPAAAAGEGGATISTTVPFIVWTQSRSGSEWFMARLSMHSAVCSSEYYCPSCPTESMSPQTRAPEERGSTCFVDTAFSAQGVGSLKSDKNVFETYVTELFELAAAGGVKLQLADGRQAVAGRPAVGYKFTSGYLEAYQERFGLSEHEAMTTLERLGIRVVLLNRVNKLDQYLSGLIAEASGMWHVDKSVDKAAIDKMHHIRLTVDTTKLLWFIKQYEQQHLDAIHLTKAYNLVHLLVNYEDCAKQPETCFCEVFTFLGLPCGDTLLDLGDTLRRSNVESHRERIVNFDEVANALRQNGWGHFLRDDSVEGGEGAAQEG